MSSNARQLIDDHAAQVQTFVTQYVFDNGVGVQMVEIIAKELFGQIVVANGTVSEDVASNPRQLFSAAVQDIAKVGIFGDVSYDLEKLLDGAASFEFIVRYARKVNPAVIPPVVIPSDEVVAAALELFHESRMAVTASVQDS